MHANWLAAGDVPDGIIAEDWWLELWAQRDKSDEEILQDTWMGPGNMWAFVRPDRCACILSAPFG